MTVKLMPFACPYNGKTCTELDSIFLTKVTPCYDCKHYDNGIKSTGVLPELDMNKWINKLKLKFAELLFKISS